MRQAGIAVSIVQIRKVDMGRVNVWQSLELECSAFDIPLCCLIIELCYSHRYLSIAKNLGLSGKRDFHEHEQALNIKIFLYITFTFVSKNYGYTHCRDGKGAD